MKKEHIYIKANSVTNKREQFIDAFFTIICVIIIKK